jgi:ABC-type phosphate transport system auxiliary subunit
VVESLTLALLLGLAALISAMGLAFMWFTTRTMMPLSLPAATTAPVLGAKDRREIHDPKSPFIQMPAYLKTHDEMVAWMTRELPKLTAEIHQRRV